MNYKFIILILLFSYTAYLPSQDTFSIVAVDSLTGEVGSAGASCVDLFNFPGLSNDFLGELFPGRGAINTQAYYLATNQANARNRMNLGETPQEIIDWLSANDTNGEPQVRQYGIAALINGESQAAAYTGSSTDDYKNHIVGKNYAIQGNILLNQAVLDSMEARFLNTEGDLLCKLLAALEGANVTGADQRCESNGTSSLFAFVKVALPTDSFGSPSFLSSVKTRAGAGIDPIDSLKKLVNDSYFCKPLAVDESFSDQSFSVSPNPAAAVVQVRFSSWQNVQLQIINLHGQVLLQQRFQETTELDISSLFSGVYFLRISDGKNTYLQKLIKQ